MPSAPRPEVRCIGSPLCERGSIPHLIPWAPVPRDKTDGTTGESARERLARKVGGQGPNVRPGNFMAEWKANREAKAGASAQRDPAPASDVTSATADTAGAEEDRKPSEAKPE